MTLKRSKQTLVMKFDDGIEKTRIARLNEVDGGIAELQK